MKAYVGITDGDWFELLASQPELDEVNFWQPGGRHTFRALKPGELFLFKLHSPLKFIVGGGFFAHATRLPVSLAWEAFGIANGATTLDEMRSRIEKYRRHPGDPAEDYTIGCILLEQPFFLQRELWIPEPSAWKRNIVQGRGFDLAAQEGRMLWDDVQAAVARSGVRLLEQPEAEAPAGPEDRFGSATIRLPRLGQGSFRLLVTDAYHRRCAITRERTLPALEAAHIRPYAEGGEHRVDNGLLLRRDLHTLFDRGYLTVTPAHKVEVSRRIREEFENGRDYYRLHGSELNLPKPEAWKPSPDFLAWHNETRFKG